MLSSIVFINQRGDVLIYRIYKDDITRSETFHFCTRLIANKNKKETPILYLDGTTFFYVSYKDFILVAATKTNVNCGMVFQFLYALLDILKHYFGEEPTEALIKAKYVLIYEILDEIIDFGIPQITESQILQAFITEGGIKLENLKELGMKKFTTLMTSATAWRNADIKYTKNQVWIDVVESVSVLLSNKGQVLKADISGCVEFNSQLSGMPECKFAINDKFLLQRTKEGEIEKSTVTIDDVKFDRCVKLSKFDRENAITFIPPDGKFNLMTYRVSSQFMLPFQILCIFNELSPTKLSYQIKVKAIFDTVFFAQNVVLTIPTPKNVINVVSNSPKGKAKHEPEKKAVMWRMKKFHGQSEVLIRTDIEVSNEGYSNWMKEPLALEFQLPSTTASGLKVLSLKINEPYQVSKWIRYMTKSGDYFQRV